MKTYKQWQRSGLDLTEFLGPHPCRIDVRIYNYIREVVPPQYCSPKLVQCGEADDQDENHVYLYATCSRTDNQYWWLGVLPEFRQGSDVFEQRRSVLSEIMQMADRCNYVKPS